MRYPEVAAALRAHKICVVMPTYNNGATVGAVIDSLLDYCGDIIVVNDGCTDDTPGILAGYGNAVTTVSYGRNRGKGYALKRGLAKAREAGFEYAVTIDSDGQHKASDLPAMVAAVIENPGALIIGARDLSKVDINGKSSFANKFSNFWFRVQTGISLSDTQTGYRVYPLKRLHGLGLITSRYESELEMLVFAAWHGIRIVSVPIDVYYPPRNLRVTHFKPALDFTRISVLNTFLCAGALVYGLPCRMVNGLRHRKPFAGDFRWFTHSGDVRRSTAVTLGKFLKSLYAAAFFVTWTMCVLRPVTYLRFRFGNVGEESRLRYHKSLQYLSRFILRNFPDARTEILNPHGETFDRPAVIVCNHQSHFDLPLLMSLSPRLVFLTNEREWNNRYYGSLIRRAEFLPVTEGVGELLPKLADLRDRGYSVVIFPEGTRSADDKVLRFHQGAFHIARELHMDVVPMVLHGVGHYHHKHDPWLRRGRMSLSVLQRVPYDADDTATLRKTASRFRRIIMEELDRMADAKENTAYFRKFVKYKYAYTGWRNVSEVKRILRHHGDYAGEIDSIPSTTGSVALRNAGTGALAWLMALVNRRSEIYAYINEKENIELVERLADVPANLHFVHDVWDTHFSARHFDRIYEADGSKLRRIK